MASLDVYEKKARLGFRFFDLNKNGYISREEMVKTADIISSFSNSSDAERLATRNQWTKWCDAILPEGQVSEEQFVERCKKLISDIPDIIWQENTLTHRDMFDRLDSDKDGFISPKELRLYYKAFGYGDDYDIDQIFRALDDNNDGLITKDEFTYALATYWSTKPGYEILYNPAKK